MGLPPSSGRSFFGQCLEQNAHISLDSFQFQLGEVCAGAEVPDPSPSVPDFPAPRRFSLGERNGMPCGGNETRESVNPGPPTEEERRLGVLFAKF